MNAKSLKYTNEISFMWIIHFDIFIYWIVVFRYLIVSLIIDMKSNLPHTSFYTNESSPWKLTGKLLWMNQMKILLLR